MIDSIAITNTNDSKVKEMEILINERLTLIFHINKLERHIALLNKLMLNVSYDYRTCTESCSFSNDYSHLIKFANERLERRRLRLQELTVNIASRIV